MNTGGWCLRPTYYLITVITIIIIVIITIISIIIVIILITITTIITIITIVITARKIIFPKVLFSVASVIFFLFLTLESLKQSEPNFHS